MKYRFIVGVGLLIVLFIIFASCFSKPEAISLEEDCINVVHLAYFAFRDGDWAAFADLHSPDYLQHSPGFDDPITWSDYELSARIVHKRIPELKFRIVDIFAFSNKVAVRSVWECPIDSSLFKYHYPDGVARGSEISIFRIEDSRIIEEWCEHDPAPVKVLCSIYKIMELNK